MFINLCTASNYMSTKTTIDLVVAVLSIFANLLAVAVTGDIKNGMRINYQFTTKCKDNQSQL